MVKNLGSTTSLGSTCKMFHPKGAHIASIPIMRLKRKAKGIILLEVDTSDGIEMLSTKVIYDSDMADWVEQFTQIRKGVVVNSISWPNDVFDKAFGQNKHIGVHHPKHQGSQAGNIPVDAIKSWAGRVAQYLS